MDSFGMWTVVPIAASVVMVILATQIRRRTARGAQWSGRILGLKHFIETVEADKLKMLVESDPKYFYSILPYAYVLGVTDKWAKQFESIAVEPPSWYYGYDGSVFTTIWFASMISNSLYYTQQNMMATKSSGGSGFGGGRNRRGRRFLRRRFFRRRFWRRRRKLVTRSAFWLALPRWLLRQTNNHNSGVAV